MDFLEHLVSPDQRSEAWLLDERLGRFTSSDCYRLMTPGKREMTPEEKAARPAKGEGSKTNYVYDPKLLSEGADTYIEEKVVELMTGCVDEKFSKEIEWGIDQEPAGKQYFMELTGLRITEKQFIKFSTFAGGSPDGDIEEIEAAFELKCPYYSRNQLQYFRELLTVHALKETWPEYYWQCVANMLWLKRTRCVFATYDPRMPEQFRMRILPFTLDPDDGQLLLFKMELAVKKRDYIFNDLKQEKWKQSINLWRKAS